MAGLYGVSPAVQDGEVQSSVSQKEKSAQTDREYHGLRRQLMWDRVELVTEPSNQQPQTDVLSDLIRQLHSLEIPQKLVVQEPNEPMSSQVDAAAVPLPSEESQISEKSEKLSQEDELGVTLKKMDKVISPLQLADVLYRQGYYELAFENYCAVGEQLTADSIVDRQWILFQKANCRRHSNLNEAVGFYNELIQSFPNSKWTTAANSQLKMIEWSQLNQIRDLVGNKTDDTNSQ